MFHPRPEMRKLSSDSSVDSNQSNGSPITSPTGSTQSMSTFGQKKAYFYIPDEDTSNPDSEDEKPTFTVTKTKSSAPSASKSKVHQPNQPRDKGKIEPQPQYRLKKTPKTLDFGLLEQLALLSTEAKGTKSSTQAINSV
jgi:hypothetical protein